MNSREYTQKVRFLATDNKRYSDDFEPLSIEGMQNDGTALRIRAMRNNRFLVQVFDENGWTRLTVNRTMIGRDGRWIDGITWNELQAIKNAVGFAGFDAVEIFPKHNDVVDVANMRHLWIVEEGLPFAWRGV